MLPFEDEVHAEVKARYGNELTLCREALQAGLDALGSKPDGSLSITPSRLRGMDRQTFSLALGLFCKACNQFRAIVALASAGFVPEAAILSRALFESALALHFILKERLALREHGRRIGNPDPARPLSTRFRARLYVAHALFDKQARIAKAKKTPRVKRLASRLGDAKGLSEQCRQMEQLIGPVWTGRLKGSRTYSGLQIRDLAYTLGLLHAYVSVYGAQSSIAHAADGLSDFDADENLEEGLLGLGPEPQGAGAVLWYASAIFVGCLSLLDTRLRLGVEQAVTRVTERVKEVAKTLT